MPLPDTHERRQTIAIERIEQHLAKIEHSLTRITALLEQVYLASGAVRFRHVTTSRVREIKEDK